MHKIIGKILFLAMMLSFVMGFNVVEAGQNELTQISNILFGESANDSKGWTPKLNTYVNAQRAGESLLQTMKRVSSAYRTESPQYVKAYTGDLNTYEKVVYKRIQQTVKDFQPDPNWKYIHHENLAHFYDSREDARIQLTKAWGEFDFDGGVKIGRETYFAKE